MTVNILGVRRDATAVQSGAAPSWQAACVEAASWLHDEFHTECGKNPFVSFFLARDDGHGYVEHHKYSPIDINELGGYNEG